MSAGLCSLADNAHHTELGGAGPTGLLVKIYFDKIKVIGTVTTIAASGASCAAKLSCSIQNHSTSMLIPY